MFQHKNKIVKVLLALSAVGLLAGCSEIEAKPSNYDDAIILDEAGEKVDVYKNLMGELYDAIAKGQNDRVKEEFIKVVCNEQFGTYAELKELAEGKDTVAEMDMTKVNAFVENHKKVYVRESDEKLVEPSGKSLEQIRAQRVLDTYKDLYKRINEALYNEVTSSSYVDDGIFSEKAYAYAKYADFYNVSVDRGDFFKGYTTALDTPLTEEDVTGLISLDNYADYIEKKIVPQIMKDKIVEEYIFNNYYSTLGRAYARNVDIVKLTSPSDDVSLQTLPFAVMRAYVDKAVYTADSGLTFKNLENAWRGFEGLDKDGNIVGLDAKELAILEAAGMEIVEVKDDQNVTLYKYGKTTKLGILLEKWNLVKDIDVDAERYPDGEEGTNGKVSAALALFTGSNTYPKEVGYKKELASLSDDKFTEDGWFVKSNGLSDYPSDSIRSRLFNIIVSNNLDSDLTMETAAPTQEFAKQFDQTKQYVRYINKNYYLVPDKYELNSFAYNMIIVDGSNYYMVQINEAPSTSKLNLEHGYAVSDAHRADPLFAERTALEIAKVLSNKDTYTNKAYASYLKDYEIIYHDQALLDYFKEQFPELFE